MSAMTSGLRLITSEPVFLTRITSMDKKRSPQPPRTKLKTHLSHHQMHTNASDSDASAETNSLSADSANEHPKELTTQTNSTNRKKFSRRRGSEWEILEGLKDGQRFDKKPEIFNGYLNKKRKWPLKGWHKRYFVLDKGILIYAKSPGDIARGKKHGSVDIGLSVISTKDKRRRIDIDAEEFIYHLKAKTIETFNCWVQQLKAHRLYRHHILTYGLRDVPLIRAANNNNNDDDDDDDNDDDTPVSRTNLPLTPPEVISSRDGSLTRGLKSIGGIVNQTSGGGGGRLAAWVIDSGPPLEQAHKEVTQVQQNIAQLTRILEHIEVSSHNFNTSLNTTTEQEIINETYSPNVKKDRKKFGLRKKKSSKGSSVDLSSSFGLNKLSDPENASPLSTNSFTGLSPQTHALSASNSSLATITMTTVPIPIMSVQSVSFNNTNIINNNNNNNNSTSNNITNSITTTTTTMSNSNSSLMASVAATTTTTTTTTIIPSSTGTSSIRPQSLPGTSSLITDHLMPSLQLNCATGTTAALSTTTAAATTTNLSDHRYLITTSSTPDFQLREDFTILAKDIINSLKTVVFTLVTERDRLKAALDSDAANPISLSATCTTSGGNVGGGSGSSSGGVGTVAGAIVSIGNNNNNNNNNNSANIVANLRNTLNQALQQNTELKTRLARVHDVSDLSDVSSVGPASEIQCRPFNASLSYSSSCVSASEFFDAEELPSASVNVTVAGTTTITTTTTTDTVNATATIAANTSVNKKTIDGNETPDGDIDGDDCRPGGGDGSDTSSEAGSLTSEEGSVSSESDLGHGYNPTISCLTEIEDSEIKNLTGRRTKLPVPRPDTEGLSLWNLLCKNIGKDLSQISMPVALNEPLNMLQRLCEELEYSELLDKAAELDDPYERMVYVAAFAVSSYASSCYRAGNKPFNPLLGETYECIREDKGFRFLAEQVSHHPPVSACYAESKHFTFWQDARIKTKFWGKSMEFQPLGHVNVRLTKTGDLYQWNKITTCVHNLFSGQRWVDQYGELKITTNTGITCKLTFAKASYWSAKRHEIYGTITNQDGKIVRKLFGKWSEALYCGVAPSAKCIWRPGTMPEDYEMYYGFTRFATELNELDCETVKHLPPTDTRLRPDQRALEEGDLDAAENLKLQLEQMQRERRKRNEIDAIQHEPKWFSKNSSEEWEFNNRYWDVRKSPGFTSLYFEPLW